MDDLLYALAGSAVTAGHATAVTAALHCHPSVEYKLLAQPYRYPAGGRDEHLRAVACGLPVHADPQMGPGQWRIELTGQL